MHARARLISCLTLAAFLPFALTAGMAAPAQALAAGNPIVSLTVGGVTFHGSESEDGNLVLAATDPAGFRIVIPAADLEELDAEEVSQDVYALVRKGQGADEPRSSLRVTLGGASGPAEGQVTYSGTAEDAETGRSLQYEAVTHDVQTRALPAVAVVVIVVVSVGAVLCLGVVGIEAATKDCARECTAQCGDGATADCETNIIAGVEHSKEGGVKVGCGAKCKSTCTSPPIARSGFEGLEACYAANLP